MALTTDATERPNEQLDRRSKIHIVLSRAENGPVRTPLRPLTSSLMPHNVEQPTSMLVNSARDVRLTVKTIWYVKRDGSSHGPLTIRDLIECMAAMDKWRGLEFRHGRSGEWFNASELESRLLEKPRKGPWLWTAAFLSLCLIAGAAAVMQFTRPLQTSLQSISNPLLSQRDALAMKLMEAEDSLPNMIDHATIRTGIKHSDPLLTFTNIILLEASAIPDATRSDISRAVTSNTCSFALARQFLAAGGSIAFSYADIGARPLMTVTVAEKNCF
ncbi:MAG: hypothetical protein NTZ54_05020 [Alphaproteobacteria bacterium]|nr:hypothetical protein [Alphaproteobacteria bacterium]